MLRVGLTGGLGSGKSTVAAFLRELGAEVIEADELGRALMEPGQQVYAEIVHTFGAEVVGLDGKLNRARLAKMAFKGGRVNELNAIVHPAVIAAQQVWMDQIFTRNRAAVAVVESALIFEVERDARLRGESETVLAGAPSDRSSSLGMLADWRRRLDRIIVVTAPDELKIARYIARICPAGTGREAAEADARHRLALQIPDPVKASRADYVLINDGDAKNLRLQVEQLWPRLLAESNNSLAEESLE
jgi:dephospho-CoA kinase